ncbi:MAG TPA: MlaD family protein [Polyangiaceae bacterium]|nr:MlaD family protein [Polyangiaceae bacterium]
MPRFTAAARVGVFTVATVVAGVLIYRFVSKTTGTGGYTVYVLLPDASGIAQHSQVRVAGIPIGHISSVKLQGQMARIDIKVRPDVALYDDAAVSKAATSFLGEYYLGVYPGTEGQHQLQDGDQIKHVLDTASTQDILQSVSEITKKVGKIAEALANTVGSKEGEQDMRDTLRNLSQVTEALNATVRENRESIRNILVTVEGITSRGQHDVDRILDNVRVVTEEVRTLVAGNQNGDQGTAGEVRQIVDRVNNASTSLEKTLKNMETVTNRLEKGEGTLGRLSKDDKLINNVENVAEGVGDIVGGMNRLQTIVSLRSDYQFRSHTVKSFVELRLQPREDKYYSFEIVNDPRGLTRIEQVDIDTTNPNDPPHYRQIRTVTTNSFRFSLQFAQRFGPLVGRFGIKESTGGVGLDLLLLDDYLELDQDLFGFGEVVEPRWRTTLGYAFLSRLWLLGGVDDILSPDRRDYYVGLQLRFNDQDLKNLLPFAPKP